MTRTAADAMRAAAAELRSCPEGHDPAVPGGTIPFAIAETIAEWLVVCSRYAAKWHEQAPVSPFQAAGLDVALAILGEQSEITIRFGGGPTVRLRSWSLVTSDAELRVTGTVSHNDWFCVGPRVPIAELHIPGLQALTELTADATTLSRDDEFVHLQLICTAGEGSDDA
ncbi:hypothetical protein ABZ883_04705 [Streptomyces sp. NPDC046977]|uniref:hypothetical protein n=1 Tax=Streptomyces sp. NPDC046977 TaxID=3154703 RepID=UPI0033F10CE8